MENKRCWIKRKEWEILVKCFINFKDSISYTANECAECFIKHEVIYFKNLF